MAKKVLIVEDNELNMKLFHDLLDAQGYETLQTREGLQALALAREQKPDLVTMDLTMPNMDGEATIEALVGLFPNLRILVVSALADKATALRAIVKGAHGFVLKPFRNEELLHALLELRA